MNELPNKLILDAKSMSKVISKYVNKIVYVYGQAFKVGVVGNLVSTLDAQMAKFGALSD